MTEYLQSRYQEAELLFKLLFELNFYFILNLTIKKFQFQFENQESTVYYGKKGLQAELRLWMQVTKFKTLGFSYLMPIS